MSQLIKYILKNKKNAQPLTENMAAGVYELIFVYKLFL